MQIYSTFDRKLCYINKLKFDDKMQETEEGNKREREWKQTNRWCGINRFLSSCFYGCTLFVCSRWQFLGNEEFRWMESTKFKFVVIAIRILSAIGFWALLCSCYHHHIHYFIFFPWLLAPAFSYRIEQKAYFQNCRSKTFLLQSKSLNSFAKLNKTFHISYSIFIRLYILIWRKLRKFF